MKLKEWVKDVAQSARLLARVALREERFLERAEAERRGPRTALLAAPQGLFAKYDAQTSVPGGPQYGDDDPKRFRYRRVVFIALDVTPGGDFHNVPFILNEDGSAFVAAQSLDGFKGLTGN